MSRIPVHHAGRAKETAEAKETTRSVRLPARVAILTPAASPMTAVTAMEVVRSSMLLGIRSRTMSETRRLPSKLRRVRASPRSRVRTRNTVSGRRKYQGLSRS